MLKGDAQGFTKINCRTCLLTQSLKAIWRHGQAQPRPHDYGKTAFKGMHVKGMVFLLSAGRSIPVERPWALRRGFALEAPR
eukprot:1103046-Rhodomonas_salina.1